MQSSILKREKALAPLCAVASQLRTAEPTENPHEIGLFGLLGRVVFLLVPVTPPGAFAGAFYSKKRRKAPCCRHVCLVPTLVPVAPFVAPILNFVKVRTKMTNIRPEFAKMFRMYPDALNRQELASMLGISEKQASKLLRSGEIPSIKIGREYRIAKVNAINFLMGRSTSEKTYVVNVTSNPQGWTSDDKRGILCVAADQKEVV